jgi:dolichyl-phosphate beta-glucosyltransferase
MRLRPRGYTIGATGRSTLLLDDADAAPGRPPASPTAAPVCVILPVFNESRLIDRTFAAVAAFAATAPNYTFLFADDGSHDDTARILADRIERSGAANIRLLRLGENRGKGHAIRAAVGGIESEEGGGDGIVCFTDGDLAYPLDHLPQLVEALQSADVVIGSRSLVHRDDRNTSPPRKMMGWTFNKLARLILHLPYKDTQAGLKGFRLRAAREIFGRQRLSGFAFDVELVFLARRLGYRVAEIPARVSEDHSDKTSKVNMIRDPLKMFLALLDIRWNAVRGRYG